MNDESARPRALPHNTQTHRNQLTGPRHGDPDRCDLLAAVNLGELLIELTGIENRGHNYPCPVSEHEQTGKSPPITISNNGDYQLWHCPVCNKGGSAIDALIAARGLDPAGAFAELRKRSGQEPRQVGGKGRISSNNRATAQPTAGCTLEQYAADKRLPIDFLRELGVSDYKDSRFGVKVLRIPYRDREGVELGARIRKELHKREDGTDERFLWRKGSRLCLYGLWRLGAVARLHADGAGHPTPDIVLCEGESDCHTLWHHGIPALGLPGAGQWKDHRDAAYLYGVERIYVVVEPDAGGAAVLRWLGTSKIRDRAWLVESKGYAKDPSGLHVADPERFAERWQAALDRAEPWRERAAQTEDAERRELWERCAELASEPRILDGFAEDLRGLGIVGERTLAQIIYLSLTSRLLEKINSLGIKGPSAAGKSVTVERTLRFFPESAFYVLTAMSERGLIFVEEGMAHRMLVIFEAAGMTGDMQSYLIRSLLSEGRIRYQMAGKGEGGEITGRVVELEGPTGLIVTTTAITLHPENETRLLSVTATDTREQTRAVLLALADEDSQHVDLERWRSLQRWIELGDKRVTIPYAKTLAELVPPVAVRLRRDFGQLLGLIRSHALLHQATRDRDQRGRIVATVEDYGVVRDLIAAIVSEGVQATVKPETRETVEAVRTLNEGEGVTGTKIGEALELDKSTASRRIAAAKQAGYLRNKEEKRGRPGRWTIADPLPDDVEILPAVARLHEHPGDEDHPPEDRSPVERALRDFGTRP